MSAPPVHVWRGPAVLGAISTFGLIAALFTDGAGDAAGWAALSVPVAAVCWFSFPWAQRTRRRRTTRR